MTLTCFYCQKEITDGISSVIFIQDGGRLVRCQECTPDEDKIPEIITCYYCAQDGVKTEFKNSDSYKMLKHAQKEHPEHLYDEPEIEDD